MSECNLGSAEEATYNDQRADPSSNTHFPILTTLLADRSPLSLGAIAMSALVVAPSSYHLYHTHYRRYCAALPDIDAWGQCYMLQLLGRYARENLRRPVTEFYIIIEGADHSPFRRMRSKNKIPT